MKRISLIFSIVLFSVLISKAQAPIDEGELQLNAGFGFSNYGMPVYAGADYGIGNNFSVGGELGYRGYSLGSFKWSIITIAGNGNYHFNEVLDIPSEWDLYAGLSLGYGIWSSNFSGVYRGTLGSGIYLTGQVGGRYFFNDNWAVNLELGGGTYSGGKIGITYLLE